MSNTLGLPYVYTATPGSAITQRLVGDVVKSFKIVTNSNLNRKMSGQLVEFKLITSSPLIATNVIVFKVQESSTFHFTLQTGCQIV